jgi:hypothetical protein
MGPGETRDLLFAGAGILWGVVTLYHGMQEWKIEKRKTPLPALIAVGAGMTLCCIGYLVCRL